MKYICLVLVALTIVDAFTFSGVSSRRNQQSRIRSTPGSEVTEAELVEDTGADFGVPPSYLPSACGIDYVPLANMLATGDFLAADQFTRDNLIKISGAEAKGRAFVYWTEVKTIPSIDLCSMERLWLQYSGGEFGFSMQKRIWDVENGNFDKFISRIGWTTVENDAERKLKWFGKNEFTYELGKAPKGHLPLTSALRGNCS
jgi:hypothetical protein